MGISPNRKDIIIDMLKKIILIAKAHGKKKKKKKIIIYSTVELASYPAWTERRVCGVEEIRLQEEIRPLLTKEDLSVGIGMYIS